MESSRITGSQYEYYPQFCFVTIEREGMHYGWRGLLVAKRWFALFFTRQEKNPHVGRGCPVVDDIRCQGSAWGVGSSVNLDEMRPIGGKIKSVEDHGGSWFWFWKIPIISPKYNELEEVANSPTHLENSDYNHHCADESFGEKIYPSPSRSNTRQTLAESCALGF